MEILAGTEQGLVASLLAEPVPVGSQCFCFTQAAQANEHSKPVRAIGQRAKRIVTGGSDGLITVGNLEAPEDERSWKLNLPGADPVTCLDISQGGKFCFVGTQGGHIFVIHLLHQKLVKMLENAHKGPVSALRIHPERFIVFTVGQDKVLSAWHPAIDKINHADQEGPLIKALEFNPSGDDLAVLSDGAIHVVSFETGQIHHQKSFPSRTVAVCWRSETELCVGTEDGYVSFFNARPSKGAPLQVQATQNKLMAMAVDGGRYLATADSVKKVILWRMDGDVIRPLCIEEVPAVPTCLTLATEEELGLHRLMREELEKEGWIFADYD